MVLETEKYTDGVPDLRFCRFGFMVNHKVEKKVTTKLRKPIVPVISGFDVEVSPTGRSQKGLVKGITVTGRPRMNGNVNLDEEFLRFVIG